MVNSGDMSVIQSKEQELRYLKRKNLDQEARIIGNYYRDIIRSYGVDCQYYKKDNSVFEQYDFKDEIDHEMLLRQAYGYDETPNYNEPTDMITYMEVENDIFQLNKYGLNPNQDVNFYFDSIDFACALATKCGQLKEYKIDETEIVCEVPCFDKEVIPNIDELSDQLFPYHLGLGYKENFNCEIMTGKLSIDIEPYELDKEYTVLCHPYEHSKMKLSFPVNSDLYRSFSYEITKDGYIETMIYLTYKVTRCVVDSNLPNLKDRYKYILTGKIHGGVLFYDINKIGKYLDKIHPEIGDIVEIDFPDATNREKYEITDCYDKQLTNDGISPLLHNYIWKCKARRYINSQDNGIETTEADDRRQEKVDFQSDILEKMQDQISMYPENEDMVYGGYEKSNHKPYDKEIPNPEDNNDYIRLDGMTGMDIITFHSGSKLTTDGYDLFFVSASGNITKMTLGDDRVLDSAYFEDGLRFIKATDTSLIFVNIEGTSFKIMEDKQASKSELQMCLNSLVESTLDQNEINKDSSCFYIFKNSRTYLWATDENLYCKFPNNKNLYKLV